MRIILIAAIGKNREIGKENNLIWSISDDLQNFAYQTKGCAVIVGRKTLESIPNGLPGRKVICVSSQTKVKNADFVFKNIETAITFAKLKNTTPIYIIGGAQIYTEAIKYAHKLELTLIDAEDSDADTFFPEFENLFYCRQSINHHDSKTGLNYKFSKWSRKD